MSGGEPICLRCFRFGDRTPHTCVEEMKPLGPHYVRGLVFWERSEARASRIRAIVAAQWVEAILLLVWAPDVPPEGMYERGVHAVLKDVAAVPCAVDIVDGAV